MTAPVPEEKLRLGGMALRNGLLVHGPTHWAAAVRDSDGEIQVASEAKPVLAPQLAGRVPLLRGPLKLAEAVPLVHGADERVAVADVELMAGFFHDLPQRVLGNQ